MDYRLHEPLRGRSQSKPSGTLMTVSLHRIEVFRRREDPGDLRGIRVWIMSRHAAVLLRQILAFRAVKGALGGYERQIEGKAMHNGQSYEAWYGIHRMIEEGHEQNTTMSRPQWDEDGDFRLSIDSQLALCFGQSVNTMCQSLASDMTTNAQICLADELHPSWGVVTSSVHDSIMLEIKEDMITQGLETIRRCMETPCIPEFDIPLKVDIAYGKNWAELGD